MRSIREASLGEVISVWANRESCDYNQILLNRMPLINRLPLDTNWIKATVEKDDILPLRLINETAWNDLSFSTGDIQIAARNLDIFSRVKLVLPDEIISHAGLTRQQYFDRLVQSLAKFRSKAVATGLNLTLILIGCCQDGPFTVLEGNHTAMGLYFRYFIDAPEHQYPLHYAYIGASPEMIHYPFFHL